MKNELICINFSSNKCKLARVKEVHGNREITDFLVKDIQGLSDSDISQVIKSLFEKMEAKNASVICSISSNLLMTKNIEIPSLKSSEIEEIIGLQSGRYTPYSKGELIVDYITVGVYKKNYTKVLVIIVPQAVVERNFDILREAGLGAEEVVIVPEAICHSYAYISKLKTVDTPVSLLYISDDSTDFLVVLKNKMVFMRNFPMGMQDFSGAKEEYEEKFVEEIKSSLESYQSEDIERNPNQIIITGSTKKIENIKIALDNALHIPVDVVPYLDNISIKKDILESIPKEENISSLDVVSPLLVLDELAVNLVPKEIKIRKKFVAKGKEIIKMGSLLMAIFILICGILVSNIYLKSAYLKKISLKYKSTNQKAQALNEDFSKIKKIKNYLLSRGHSLEILNALYRVISPTIYLDSIKVNGEGGFTIKGTSETMATVFKLVGDMEKSKYFQNVRTKYTKKRKEENKDLTDFHIVCTLVEREQSNSY